MNIELINALNGKTESRGGLNIKDLRDALISLFPSETENIKVMPRSDLEYSYKEMIQTTPRTRSPRSVSVSEIDISRIPYSQSGITWILLEEGLRVTQWLRQPQRSKMYKNVPVLYTKESIIEGLKKDKKIFIPEPPHEIYNDEELVFLILRKYPEAHPLFADYIADNYDIAIAITNAKTPILENINHDIVDKNLALLAVKNNPLNMKYLIEEFTNDIDIARVFAHSNDIYRKSPIGNISLFKYLGDKVRRNIEFITELYETNISYKKYIDDINHEVTSAIGLKNKLNLFDAAYFLITDNEGAIDWLNVISDNLLDDPDFMYEVYKIDPEVADQYVGPTLRRYPHLYKPSVRGAVGRSQRS